VSLTVRRGSASVSKAVRSKGDHWRAVMARGRPLLDDSDAAVIARYPGGPRVGRGRVVKRVANLR
jgi:hypothetical protein